MSNPVEAQYDLNIPDEDWLTLAERICQRRLLSEEDYEAFVVEIERDALNEVYGRAVRDVGQTAIQLFCPFS